MILHWTSIAREYYISAIFRGIQRPLPPSPDTRMNEYLQHFQYNTRGSVEAPTNLNKTISHQAQARIPYNLTTKITTTFKADFCASCVGLSQGDYYKYYSFPLEKKKLVRDLSIWAPLGNKQTKKSENLDPRMCK